jgi:hypothetical protein
VVVYWVYHGMEGSVDCRSSARGGPRMRELHTTCHTHTHTERESGSVVLTGGEGRRRALEFSLRLVAHFTGSSVQARRRGDRAVLGAVVNGRGGDLRCPFYRVNDERVGGFTQVVVGHFKSFGYGKGIVKQMNTLV